MYDYLKHIYKNMVKKLTYVNESQGNTNVFERFLSLQHFYLRQETVRQTDTSYVVYPVMYGDDRYWFSRSFVRFMFTCWLITPVVLSVDIYHQV